MPTGVAGEEITPLTDVDFDSVTITPTVAAGANAQVLSFNNSYAFWADNAGSGGDNTRLWLDTPDNGEVIIGPRAGGSNLGQIRLRHDKVSGVLGVVLRQDSGGILYLTSSSRRYKLDITDHQMDLDALRRLRVVKFKDRTQIETLAETYAAEKIANIADPGVRPTEEEFARALADAPWYVGVIAEEVEELGLSELITYEDDPDRPGEQRPGGFRYELVALGALQLIEEQEKRIATLEERLDRIEQQGR